MGRRFTYACELAWGGDVPTAELEVECSFTVAWGSAETGRFGRPEDYDCGSPDEIEDIKILTVGGKPWPVDLSYGFQTPAQDHEMLVDKLESEHAERMLEEAREEEAGAYADAMERRWEERRDERLTGGDQ